LADKSKIDDAYIVFDGTTMKVYLDNHETNYLKMYPTSTSGSGLAASGSSWSGTGFALNNGYIATNYHVVENAKSITIQGVAGNASEKYTASVIATDKVNDLALIQIQDSNFKGFGQIPYRVKTSTSDVGEDVFVLGYPLTTTMGNEIKLTTGIISSKTGFMGDVALYQISAPIQPGNSGGPLFDNQGNLIGIINAKHTGAENVGYAIKASYLNNLVESVTSNSILPSNNTVSAMNLTNKVKSIEKFVFMIVCSN
jgi:S1-C subfamily serine protease